MSPKLLEKSPSQQEAPVVSAAKNNQFEDFLKSRGLTTDKIGETSVSVQAEESSALEGLVFDEERNLLELENIYELDAEDYPTSEPTVSYTNPETSEEEVMLVSEAAEKALDKLAAISPEFADYLRIDHDAVRVLIYGGMPRELGDDSGRHDSINKDFMDALALEVAESVVQRRDNGELIQARDHVNAMIEATQHLSEFLALRGFWDPNLTEEAMNSGKITHQRQGNGEGSVKAGNRSLIGGNATLFDARVSKQILELSDVVEAGASLIGNGPRAVEFGAKAAVGGAGIYGVNQIDKIEVIGPALERVGEAMGVDWLDEAAINGLVFAVGYGFNKLKKKPVDKINHWKVKLDSEDAKDFDALLKGWQEDEDKPNEEVVKEWKQRIRSARHYRNIQLELDSIGANTHQIYRGGEANQVNGDRLRGMIDKRTAIQRKFFFKEYELGEGDRKNIFQREKKDILKAGIKKWVPFGKVLVDAAE